MLASLTCLRSSSASDSIIYRHMLMVKCTLACFLMESQYLLSDPALLTCEKVKKCFQKFYDRIVSAAAIKCQYKIFGHYQRYLFLLGFLFHVTIARFYKPGSHHTDAVLLGFMLPYTRFTADDCVKIILQDQDNDSTLIDFDVIQKIRRKFRKYISPHEETDHSCHKQILSPEKVHHLLLSLFKADRIRLEFI